MIPKNIFPQVLVSRLKEKKKLLEANSDKHKEIKTALIVDGGAMKGAFAAGVTAALKELGYEDVFDIVAAVSSGGIAASYFLSGQGEIAPRVFYEGLASRKFINFYKLHPAKVVGSEYAVKVFSQMFPLNQQTIRNSRSAYYMGVTDLETGERKYLDIKKDNIDVIEGIYASSTVPLMQNKIIAIGGKTYLDGMIRGIPVDIALQKKCTDILIIENSPLGKPEFPNIALLKVVFALFGFKTTPKAAKAIFEKNTRYFETLKEIVARQKQGIHIGIISPDKVIAGPFSINRKNLKQTAEKGRLETMRLFSES